MSELLPCPFCGSEVSLNRFSGYGIGCTNCRCDLSWFETEEEAIEAWNTRVKPTCTYEQIIMYDEEGIEGYECDNCGNTIYASDGIPKVCPRCKMEVSNHE